MQKIAYEILAYMLEHPDAQDTLQGITEWWLPGVDARPNPTLVAEALAELTALGFILARRGEDARAHYKVNRRRLKEISDVLRRQAGADDTED
ncbi:MAG TPA: hypothetical protein VKB12_16860 [Pyrinomonadaceae bacterium]|nr:hypothetical protein [Pyrinomonadaceae bacterium]